MHNEDQQLRRHHFVIASRPKNSEPTWKYAPTGKLMTQAEALNFVAWLKEQKRQGICV